MTAWLRSGVMDESVDESLGEVWTYVGNKSVRDLMSNTVRKGPLVPGVLMEVRDEGKVRTLLIGDVNPLMGVCDDCTDVSGSAIVIRYRKVWRP